MKDQSSDKEKTPDQPGYRYAQLQKEPTPQDAIDYLEKGPVAPEPSFKEKPDFEVIAEKLRIFSPSRIEDIKAGCEKIWSDYVIPLQKEIEELRKAK